MSCRIPDAPNPPPRPIQPLPCRPADALRLCRLLKAKHVPAHRPPARAADQYDAGPVLFHRYLEEQNREDRSAAKRLEFCPLPLFTLPEPCPQTPVQPRPSREPRGDERPHQDPHRPAAARIGDVPPVPPTPPLPRPRATQPPPPPRPGRLIDVLA